LNTTGIAMPPKGGNAALTTKDIQDVVAYVRALK
jgi:disulfide bond formation protein DsbB